jgi:tetratricopeptide (TPR) repeat protein
MFMEAGMSLLNDALRKKDKELKQTGNINLFQNPPTKNRKFRTRQHVFPALILVLIGVLALGGWQLFFQTDTPLSRPQITENKNIEAEPDLPAFKKSQPRIDLAAPNKNSLIPQPPAVQTESSTRVASNPDTAVSMPERQAPQKNDKLTTRRTKELKNDDKQSQSPLKANALKTVARNKKNRLSAKTRRRKTFSAEPEEHFYDKAVRYHRSNELSKAILMYQEVLKENPKHYDARFNLASASLRASLFPEAYNILEKLHKQDPANPQILLNLAIAEIGLKRPQKAILHLDKAALLDNKPQFEIFFNRGVVLSRLGKLEKAESCYKKAEALNPGNPQLIFNLAVIYDKLQRYRTALKYYGAFLKNEGASSALEKKEVENRVKTIRIYLP